MRSAVIVETRFNPDLPNIIQDHFRYLSGDWQLIIYGSSANKDQLTGAFPEALFYELPSETISFDYYNELLRTPEFWLQIPDEDILIFQYDSKLLKKGIEKFFEWDYVGSPWSVPEWGGNGGLSIRKKSVMLACIATEKPDRFSNEDGYFCDIMRRRKIGKLAPREVCSEFSCETIFKLGTYGHHKANGYLTPDQFKQVMEQYKTVWIVATGESLLRLRKEHIGAGLVFTLGNAITVVENLDLENEIWSMQKDGPGEGYKNVDCPYKTCNTCPFAMTYPKKAKLLLHIHESKDCLPGYENKEYFDNEANGLVWRTESVLSAIELLQRKGYETFKFLCFDSVTNGSINNFEGFRNGLYVPQAERLKERAKTLDCEFIEPT